MTKCVECGYLTVRDEDGKGAFEALLLARTKGIIKTTKGLTTNADISCYVQSQAFPPVGPMPQSGVHKPFDDHPVVKAINENHDCQKSRTWWAGKSPKEHEEMSHLEVMRSLYAQEQAKIEKRVEDGLRQATEWRNEDRSLALTNLVVTAGVALLTTVVTLIAAKLIPWFMAGG